MELTCPRFCGVSNLTIARFAISDAAPQPAVQILNQRLIRLQSTKRCQVSNF